MNKRFAAINAANDLRGFDVDRFSASVAEHMGELNAIHPFLDGNGRTARAFLVILAERAGHEIDLARIDPRVWNAASAQSFHKLDYAPMRKVIGDAMTTREQESVEKSKDAGDDPMNASDYLKERGRE